MKVLLAALFLSCALAGHAPAQLGVEDWEDRLMAGPDQAARVQVFQAAAGEDSAGARAFLDRRLRRDAPDEQTWLALGCVFATRVRDVPSLVADLDRRYPKADDRVALWRLFLDAPPWRAEARRMLMEAIDRHRHDPRGEELLPLLASVAEKDGPEVVAALLLSLYEDQDCGPLAARAFALGRSLPAKQRRDFDVAALLGLDEHFALESARSLLDDEIDGTEFLIEDSLYGDPGHFVRAGLHQLLVTADTRGAALRIGVMERIEEADDDLLTMLRRLFSGLTTPELDLLAAQALEKGGPNARALAFDRLRSGRFTTSPVLLEKLIAQDIPDRSLIAALDALAAISGRSRDRAAVDNFLAAGDVEIRIARLEALDRAAPRSPELRSWVLREIGRSGRDWARRARLLRLAGRLGAPESLALAESAFEHPRWQVRLAAIEALIALGNRPALARLAMAAGEPRLRLARCAERGLRRLTGEDYGTDPEAWLRYVARLPRDWSSLLHPDAAPKSRAVDLRYAPNFYGLDLGSNRVVFVCDSSGSMQGEKIEGLTRELEQAVSGLDTEGAFNVVFFAEQAKALWPEIRSAETVNRKRAREFTARQSAGGGTNLWAGIERALDDEEADTLVVLTDGQPTLGELVAPDAILAEFSRRNRDLRLQVHAIELGAIFRGSAFMERLAADNQGRHIIVP